MKTCLTGCFLLGSLLLTGCYCHRVEYDREDGWETNYRAIGFGPKHYRASQDPPPPPQPCGYAADPCYGGYGYAPGCVCGGVGACVYCAPEACAVSAEVGAACPVAPEVAGAYPAYPEYDLAHPVYPEFENAGPVYPEAAPVYPEAGPVYVQPEPAAPRPAAPQEAEPRRAPPAQLAPAPEPSTETAPQSGARQTGQYGVAPRPTARTRAPRLLAPPAPTDDWTGTRDGSHVKMGYRIR